MKQFINRIMTNIGGSFVTAFVAVVAALAFMGVGLFFSFLILTGQRRLDIPKSPFDFAAVPT